MNSLSAAAVLADEYMLTHKTAFSSVPGQNYSMSMFSNNEKPLFSHSMRPVARFAEQGKTLRIKEFFLLFRPWTSDC